MFKIKRKKKQENKTKKNKTKKDWVQLCWSGCKPLPIHKREPTTA